MTSRCFIVVISVAFALPARSQEAAASFDGVWEGFVVEGKGENPNAGPVKIELKIDGNRIVATDLRGEKKGLGEGTFTLAKKGPLQTIDAVRTSSPGKGQTHLGIVSLEGDTLRWCSATPNKERPETFETKRGQFLLVVKRVKK